MVAAVAEIAGWPTGPEGLVAYVMAVERVDRQGALVRLNQWCPGWQGHDTPPANINYVNKLETE
jgi:hypothetical protein